MTTVETIPRAAVIAALEALGVPLGEPFNRTMIVHISGDHISYEQADGQSRMWRRIVDECPSCHATPNQPHTEYCPVALGHITPEAERFAPYAEAPASAPADTGCTHSCDAPSCQMQGTAG